MTSPIPQDGNTKDEKLDLLSRTEVRTMAKDIAALREQEALKEREKIQTVQSQGPTTSSDIGTAENTQTAEDNPAPPSSLFQLPELPSVSQKVLVRIVLGGIAVLILVNFAMFLYWYFTE